MIAFVPAFAMLLLQNPWSPGRLMSEIGDGSVERDQAEVIQWFGGRDRLKQGADVKVSDTAVAWAMLLPSGGNHIDVVATHTRRWDELAGATRAPAQETWSLQRVGKSDLFVGAFQLKEGDACQWQYAIDGKPSGSLHDLEVYATPPEAKPDPVIPSGKLEQQPPLVSKIFGGTSHDWWIYVPASYDPGVESNLVIFQDGQWSHSYGPVYFDNMIARHDLSQTIVVFVTPGTFPDKRSDRSREYDTLSDSYVRFLLEELLPPVEAKYKITQDPMRRCVAGISSGGICSFTAAWQRPDKFGLVMSWVGSFTDIAAGKTLIEGGHNYPALIRKTPKKRMKVFLQDGASDLDNEHGNWPLSNYQMALALRFAKYDLKTIWGNGFHSDKQGRATMPEALRWLFAKP